MTALLKPAANGNPQLWFGLSHHGPSCRNEECPRVGTTVWADGDPFVFDPAYMSSISYDDGGGSRLRECIRIARVRLSE